MSNFSKAQIDGMLNQLKDEFGHDIATEELAILELEDMKRKGCLLEHTDGYCIGCSALKNHNTCPMNDWDKRHPEYKNDELAMRIKVLEAGGEEAYEAKIKALEEFEKNKASYFDKAKACHQLLNLYFDNKTTATSGGILDLLHNIINAKTKPEIQDELDKLN